MRETRRTLCNRDCPDVCGILADVEDGRIVQLRGDKDHPVTRGFLCHRTSHFLPRQYAPDRLTAPMLRRGDSWESISWDAALDLAVEKLERARREDGPAAVLHYRSGGSLGALVMLTDYFFERWGPVTTKRGDICSGAGDAAQLEDFGEEDSHDLHDLLNARHVILWGKNAFVSSLHTVPVLKDARSRGTELVLVDPVHTRTVSLCQAYVQPRPGGDLALAMAIIALLDARGGIDPRAAEWCDNLEELRALARARSVADWCRSADVSEEQASDLARRLTERPCAILVGWGMQRRVNGSAIVRALDALCAITGNIGIPGGGVSFYFKRRGAFDLSFIRGEAAAPRTLCEPLLGREILDAKAPPVRVAWITAGNPVAMLPGSETVAEALRTREFVVVADGFMTDTARLANLVLPTPTLLESDDLLGAYGHHYLGASTPVVPPPPGVRSDLQIMQGLAERTGLADVMAGDARAWKRRILAGRMEPRGVTIEALEAGVVRNPLPPRVLFGDRKFATPTGRVNLMSAWPEHGEGLPAQPGYPLFLMSVSTDRSQASQWVEEPRGPAEVTVHPRASDVQDGAEAWLESAQGKLRVRVVHDERQRVDVVLIPKGGSHRAGRGANALVRARLTDKGEGAAYYDERVRLVPVA